MQPLSAIIITVLMMIGDCCFGGGVLVRLLRGHDSSVVYHPAPFVRASSSSSMLHSTVVVYCFAWSRAHRFSFAFHFVTTFWRMRGSRVPSVRRVENYCFGVGFNRRCTSCREMTLACRRICRRSNQHQPHALPRNVAKRGHNWQPVAASADAVAAAAACVACH
uniref:Putative secreted protein n=1 Tax=Anopheles darlingi TaxID=43151 RepID=A0A2M4DC00_ANODA